MRRLFLAVVALGLLTTALGVRPTSAQAAVARHRLLLIIAGQSNALGAYSFATDPTTGINYLAKPYANRADSVDRIIWQSFPVQYDYTTPVPLDTPQTEVPAYSPNVQVFGPEVGLARQFMHDTHRAATIVKFAWVDTNLAVDWAPSGWIYPRMVSLVKGQVAADAAHGVIDTIGGFFWFQGESDAADSTMSSEYQDNLAAFIAAVRADVTAAAPVVLVKEIHPWAIPCGAPCADLATGDAAVRAADDWAAANLAKVVTVDSAGLPRYAGGVHLTNEGELTLGAAMAKAFEVAGHYRH